MITRLAELAKNRGIVVGASTLSMAAGFLVGFYYAKFQLEKKFTEIATTEIDEAREYYKTLYKKEEFATPEQAVETLVPKEAVEALRKYSGPQKADLEDVYQRARLLEDVGTAGEEGEVVLSIFEEAKVEVISYEDEERNRTEEAPYIISKDEFMENDTDFRQITLTYFVGDAVLVDEREDRIDDVDNVVGDNNVGRFGHRSEDKNVVYVRNHVLETDFEILKSEGKYAVEVAGLQEE